MKQTRWLSGFFCLLLCTAILLSCLVLPAQAAGSSWKNNVFLPEKLTLDLEEVDTLLVLPTAAGAPRDALDVSQAGNRSVLAWIQNGTLYLAGEGGVNAREAFLNFETLKNIPYLLFNGCFHTEEVTSLAWVFHYAHGLRFADFSGLDLSRVTDMSYMFGNSGLVMADFTGVKTPKLQDMSFMFANCINLIQPLIQDLDTENVTNMDGVFYEAYNIASLDLRSWDTGKVTSMSQMFRSCNDLLYLDISTWDTSEVTDFNGMFMNYIDPEPLNTRDWSLGVWETQSASRDEQGNFTSFYDFMPPGTQYQGYDWEKFIFSSPEVLLDPDFFPDNLGIYLRSHGYKSYTERKTLPDGTLRRTFPQGNARLVLEMREDQPGTITLTGALTGLTYAEKTTLRGMFRGAGYAITGETDAAVFDKAIRENVYSRKNGTVCSRWAWNGVDFHWTEDKSSLTLVLTLAK